MNKNYCNEAKMTQNQYATQAVLAGDLFLGT
jgi:hypothetical protein